MIAYVELTAQTIGDFGVGRKMSTLASLIVTFLVGVPSAVKIEFLQNQDFVWGFALIISGLGYWFLLIRYGPFKYRKCIVNDVGIKDWNLPYAWTIIVSVMVPVEASVIIIWWAYTNIRYVPDWYEIQYESLAVTFLEWAILFVLLGGMNIVVYLLKVPLFEKAHKQGYDPFHPEAVPPKSLYETTYEIPISSQEDILETIAESKF